MIFYTYGRQISSKEDFITFWERRYRDPREQLYMDSISPPLTAEKVRNLYIWKNGGVLSKRKMSSVEQNYLNRLDELAALPATLSAQDFLLRFTKGGAIWRIFWLHCWQPDRFPIYDQHVHRAMTYLQDGKPEELDDFSDLNKEKLYLNRYLQFNHMFTGMGQRKVDAALLAFGQFIKRWSLPTEG